MKISKFFKLNQQGFAHEYFVGLIVIAVLAVVGVRVMQASHAQTPPASTFYSPSYWMINDGQLAGLVNAGLPTALQQYFFNSPRTFILTSGTNPSLHSQYPNAKLVKKFTSEPVLAAAVKAGLPPNISYVSYDNETWPQTPAIEQACPIDYGKLAAQAAHAANVKIAFTPAVDLSPNLTDTSHCKYPLSNLNQFQPAANVNIKYTDYLNQNFAGHAAPGNNVFEIQSQQLETNPVAFALFTAEAVNQANAATNGNVTILAGLTTDDAQGQMTLSQLMSAYNTTKNRANGYWLNIPTTGTPNFGLGVQFLQAVYNER